MGSRTIWNSSCGLFTCMGPFGQKASQYLKMQMQMRAYNSPIIAENDGPDVFWAYILWHQPLKKFPMALIIPRLVSRLDHQTSGVLPMALGPEDGPAAQWLQAQFASCQARGPRYLPFWWQDTRDGFVWKWHAPGIPLVNDHVPIFCLLT